MPRDPRLWDLAKGASKLNKHRDEVIQLFRDGLSLAKLSKHYGMVATGVQKWLRMHGEYDRTTTCELPECEITFPFRPRKRYCSRLHVRRANSRVRNARPEEKIKNAARNKLRQAVYDGRVLRPLKCERCNQLGGFAKDGRSLIQADHHHGYENDHALNIWWICKSCDTEIEKLRRSGLIVTKETRNKASTKSYED